MVIAAIFASISYAFAHAFGFFISLPKKQLQTVPWKDTFQVFLVFLFLQFFLIPLLLLLKFNKNEFAFANAEFLGWLSVGSAFLLIILMILFLLYFKKSIFFSFFYSKHPAHDILLGCYTWVIAFASVLVYSLLMQIILADYFGFPLEDQLAVRQIKEILPYQELFYATIVMVVFLIPIIEEILFRGFLQTSLRGYFSPWGAIFICSLIFALFHFSSSQGMNNFNILGSLFFLSLFLGFLRERQGNCLASIAMHTLFNGISIVMVLNGLD